MCLDLMAEGKHLGTTQRKEAAEVAKASLENQPICILISYTENSEEDFLAMKLAIDLLTLAERPMPRSSKAKQESWPGTRGFCRALILYSLPLVQGS